MSKPKVLITGVSGILGNNLAEALRPRYHITGTYRQHEVNYPDKTIEVDLSDAGETEKLITDSQPDIIIHCAALADPDACAEDHKEADLCNIVATKNIVACAGSAKLIHISTDTIFDGKKGNYSEEDEPNPINYYGETKLKAEKEALKNENAIIARTNFFGWDGENRKSLAEWAFCELKAGRPIKGFTDVHFTSIYTYKLADLFVHAIEKDLRGVYNFTSSTSMNKFEFVNLIAEKCGQNTELITPISVDEFGLTAKRAKNLTLDVNKLSRDLGVEIPTMEDSVIDFCNQIMDLRPVK